jgi:hypothetical protein
MLARSATRAEEGLAKRGSDRLTGDDMAASSESEVIAQQVSALGHKVEAIEARLGEIERVIAGLEIAALTTARGLQEVSRHWDAVYDAMRRVEEPDVGQLSGGRESSRPSKRKR